MTKLLAMHVHATSQNKGDYALLISLLQLLKEDVEIIDVCTQPETHKHVVDYLNIKNMGSLLNFLAFARALRKADAIVLGGGDVITASNNLLLLSMARITGTPIYFTGVGVNLRHVSKLSMLYLKYSLPGVSCAFIRDTKSAQKLLDLGLDNSQLIEVSDLTFAHGALGLAPNYKKSGLELPKNFIAVSIRAPEFNSSKWGSNEYKNIAKALDLLIEQYQLEVVFVSMADEYHTVSKSEQTSDELPDSEICRVIQSHMTNQEHAKIVNSDLMLDDIMSIFDKATIAICCRLHAMIFSTLVTTPFIGLTYNLKSESYLRDAGIPEFGVDLSSVSSEQLYAKASGLIENYDSATTKTRLACQRFSNKAKAYTKLTNMIEKVPQRSVFRIFHPKLWSLYFVNLAYEIYTKLSR